METIDLDKVKLHDTRYCISYPLEDDLLLSSVTRFGVLTPVCLLDTDPPVTITGFKRLHAARKAGITRVPCTRLSVDERQGLLTSINDNINRSLNTVEKSHCVQKMAKLNFSTEELFAVMKLLGLPPREKALQTALGAAAAETTTKDFIVANHLPLSVVEQLLAFDAGQRDVIIRICSAFRSSVSSLREVFQLLMLLDVKKGVIEFQELEDVHDMDELRQRLKRMLHPVLFSLEEKLVKIRALSALSPNISIKVDPVFEKETIDIRIQAHDSSDVQDAVTKLGSLLEQGLFRSLFELTHGTPGRN